MPTCESPMLNIRQRDHIRAPISLWWARAMTVRVQSRLRQEKVRKVSCNFGTRRLSKPSYSRRTPTK